MPRVINTQWILASLTLFTAVHLSAQDCGKDSCRPSDLERLAEQSQVIATEGMKEDCKEGQICTSEIWKGTNPFQVDKGGGEFLGHKCTMFSVTENGPQGDLAVVRAPRGVGWGRLRECPIQIDYVNRPLMRAIRLFDVADCRHFPSHVLVCGGDDERNGGMR